MQRDHGRHRALLLLLLLVLVAGVVAGFLLANAGVAVAGDTATTLVVTAATGTYGGTVDLTATLTVTDNADPIASQTINFYVNSESKGSASTNGSGVATLNGVALTVGGVRLNVGTYTGTYNTSGIGADFAGDATYDISTGAAALTVNKADQTITVTQTAPASATYGNTFTVVATSSSGLAVAITTDGTVCSGSGSGAALITMASGTGTGHVYFKQAGNANFNAATQVQEDVTAQKAAQTITVTAHAPATATYGGTFTVTATSSSGLGVAITTDGTVCTGSGSGAALITVTSSTSTGRVYFNQAGNANYNAATQVQEDVTAQKANQTITVTAHAPATATYGGIFTVTATSSSGLAVAITTDNVICTGSGSGAALITMDSGTGTGSVYFNQAGDANYNAATQVQEDVNAQKADQTITVTTPAPGTASYGDNFTVIATSFSGLPVAITTDNVVCIGSGSGSALITMASSTGTGHIYFNQAGDANYNAATQVQEDVNAQTTNQTITVTTPAPGTATYGDTFTVVATSSSGLPVAITTDGVVCTGSGSGSALITMASSTGTGHVYFNQAGDATYNAATQVTEDITAQQATLTITANDRTKTYGDTVTFAGTEFTAMGLVNSNNVTSVTLTSDGAGATAAVATYGIVPSSAVGTGLINYTILYVNGTLTVTSGAATHIAITSDNVSAVAGTPFSVTVTAYDDYGNVVTGYAGTATFTSSDPNPTLPADYTFTSSDGGVHAFTNEFTLRTSPSQSITVTDISDANLYDTATWSVSGGATVRYTVTSESYTQETTVSFTVTLTAYDEFGNVAAADNVSVTMTSSLSDMVFDGNGNGTFGEAGDEIGVLMGGTLDIQAKARSAAKDVIIAASDGTMTAEGPPYTIEDFRCFIATAAYGTPMTDQIQVLRDFRDGYLMKNPAGRWFVSTYYRCSPPLARFIAHHDSLRAIVRICLAPVIWLTTLFMETTLLEKIAILVSMIAAVSTAVLWLRRRRPSQTP
jgi:hypothetical protein